MTKQFCHSLFFTVLLLSTSFLGFAQNMPIKGKAIVLEYAAPYGKIKVDMTNSEDDFIKEIVIKPETNIIDKRNRPFQKELLAPGSEIEIEGQYDRRTAWADKIEVLTPWVGAKVELNGILEYFDATSGVAIVDGQKVKLYDKTVIKGKGRYKGLSFKSLSEISLGNFMSMEGTRQQDGVLSATEATVEENVFDAHDKELITTLESEFSAKNLMTIATPEHLKKYAKDLKQGNIALGDALFKLSPDLNLQAYINYVGNRLVPDWQKEIPDSADDKINYRFYVIEANTFNAFALPNGMIFVHTGLLKMIDNEAQLAAVLGHEIAHITHEHGKERYVKQQKSILWGSLFNTALHATLKLHPDLKNVTDKQIYLTKVVVSNLAEDGATVQTLVSSAVDVLKSLINLKLSIQSETALTNLFKSLGGISSSIHSKGRENQSDRVGLRYMYQAGYDPREAAKIWAKFMDKTKDKNYIEQANNLAKEWLLSSERYPNQNPLASVGDFFLGKLANLALNNWFSSHPKAKTRFRSLNELVATNYIQDKLEGTIINTERFDEIQNLTIGKLGNR